MDMDQYAGVKWALELTRNKLDGIRYCLYVLIVLGLAVVWKLYKP